MAGLMQGPGPSTTAGTVTETAERGDVVLEVIPFGEYRELPTAAPADMIMRVDLLPGPGRRDRPRRIPPMLDSWPSIPRTPGS